MIDEDRVVREHAPLVEDVLARYSGRVVRRDLLDDLRQEGLIALVESARRYEPGRGVSFRGYAHQRVWGAMRDFFRSVDYLKRSQRGRAGEGAPAPPVPLDAPLSGTDVPVVELLVDPAAEAEFDAVDERDRARSDAALLSELMDVLPERERQIVEAHDLEGVSLTQLAREQGVSHARVSQIRTRALRRMEKAA